MSFRHRTSIELTIFTSKQLAIIKNSTFYPKTSIGSNYSEKNFLLRCYAPAKKKVIFLRGL